MGNFIKTLKRNGIFTSGKGITKDTIKRLENELGLSFSKEYKEYLCEFGYACSDGHEFTGVSSSKRIDVVTVTKYEKDKNPFVPNDFYVVEQTNIDDIVIWQSNNGEIWQSKPSNHFEKICNSLSKYIEL